ncbi:hypothetical protein E4U17_002950 [Claviceps sp. LM77 group G4]|nr:hypothetical protein E4U17_002950 [Claviceps sp. LM77 group G4]KAG6075941.1 hypothetical protein E4U16_003093 [Claviceps sp. LM84 group G4]KAG6081760.1 hypothetical protein E4U33_006480 [Claviceps sp. LM78 group G4]
MSRPSKQTAKDTEPNPTAEPEVVRFSPEEERALLEESNTTKAEANALYSTHDYENALSRYQDALSTCPNYLLYERAVVQSNMAACYLHTEQWKDAIKAATSALDGLATLEGKNKAKESEQKQELDGGENNKNTKQQDAQKKNGDSSSEASPKTADQDGSIEGEIISAGAARAAPGQSPSSSQLIDGDISTRAAEKREADVRRIRIKALLRRARARAEAGGWHNLTGAEEDYKLLSTMPGLGAADMRKVREQLVALPPRTRAAQEEELSEMWGKLKTLGDGILKPFGLSTSNFQMVKDEKSGGYSMNFSSGEGSAKKG